MCISRTNIAPLLVPTVKRALSADQSAATISCCGICGPKATLIARLEDASQRKRKSDAAGRVAKVAPASS